MTSSAISRLIFTVFVITITDRAVAIRNGDLRLVSANTTKGWVEIYYNSEWYTISGQFIIYDISKVVCRQLGLPFTEAVTVDDPYVKRPLDKVGVLSTTLFCDGDEARLEDCRNFDWSFPQFYTHDYDVAVHCAGENIHTGDLRLVGGVDDRSGRLEIFMGKAWESFCSIGFGVTEATVACRQLGLLNTSDVDVFPDAYFGMGNIGDGPYIARCTGDEKRIDSCSSFYRSFDSVNYDELFCSHSQDVGICCPSDIGGCTATYSTSGTSTVGSIVGSIIVVVVVLLIIGCCCYCCCKKKKGKQQYTTVVQNPAPQPAGGGQQAPAPTTGSTAPPVYYHGPTPGYPAVNIGQPNTQSYPIQYPHTGQAMPPPAPVAGTNPYPPQTNPYPTGQVPPPAAAGSIPYPSQPYPYPSGQAPPPAGTYPAPPPQQPGYNPTAATGTYPAAPYPPQAAPAPGPAYGASSAEQSYPTKGDVDHPLPSHAASGTPSAPPMDMGSGQGEIPSAPPPAYEHLIG
nr:scavenger receptor cysteine-rich type 1 protein M160-like [Lytechinus pictus]